MTTRGRTGQCEAAAGGHRRAWKPAEGRQRRAGGGALPLVEVHHIYENATTEFSQITLKISIEVENM
jgi:hypothetical protein